MNPRASGLITISVLGTVFGGGCAAGGRVQLAAADALSALGPQLALVVAEYHENLNELDNDRERALVDALIARLRVDIGDETLTARHADEFAAALVRVRADREVEWKRYAATMQNIALMSELSRGLRESAVDAMSLDDEVSRYVDQLFERAMSTGDESEDKVDESVDRDARPALSLPHVLLRGSTK